MKKYLSPFLLVPFFVLNSCSKNQEDKSPPGLTVTSPLEGDDHSYVEVKCIFGDYYLSEMKMEIIRTSDNTTLVSKRNSYSTVQNDEFDQTFRAADMGITTPTQVKVQITVRDDFNNVTSKVINCTVHP